MENILYFYHENAKVEFFLHKYTYFSPRDVCLAIDFLLTPPLHPPPLPQGRYSLGLNGYNGSFLFTGAGTYWITTDCMRRASIMQFKTLSHCP